ncbi:MAG: hypothetical protein M3R55_09400 [Acidobacteriota bacterium]|nr:hypothetical protein [Acidobacteriota bacterium]
MTRAHLLFTVCLLSAGAVAGARVPEAQSTRDGAAMQKKLAQISQRGLTPGARRQSTTITEAEVNGYLRHHTAGDLPEGVVGPHVTILGNGRVSGRATVDLDRVRTSQKRGWLDPAAYLTGRLPVTATGVLHTKNGVGKFELETATVGGIAVPKVFLQELLSYYSRSPEDADGINLDETFELPARIKEIQVGKGLAHVIQ